MKRASGQRPGTPTLSLSGQNELAGLVALAGQRLHLNVDYDASAVKAAVTLRLEGPVSDQDLWLLVNRLLASRGFTTVRASGQAAFSVVKLSDAPALARPEPVGASPEPGPQPGFHAVTVRLEHRSAKDAIDAVSKALSKPAGTVTPLGDSGSILIADLTDRLDSELQVLKAFDSPAGVIAADEVLLHHISAPSMAALSAQVNAKREAAGAPKVPGDVVAMPGGAAVMLVAPTEHLSYWKDLIQRLDQRQDTTVVTYRPRAFAPTEVGKLIEQTVRDGPDAGADDRFRVVVDELTGSLIVTATPEQHTRIRAIVDRLDQAATPSARPVRTFVVRNRPVHEIQGILEQLMTTGVLGDASEPSAVAEPQADLAAWPPATTPKAPAPTPASATASARERLPGKPANVAGDRPVVLSADEATNTLIAMGEARLLTQIESLLKSLDIRQPQVMLEVLIVSLSRGQTLDLGVELERTQTIGDVRTRLSSLFGLGSRGASGDRTAGDGAGFTGLVLSPGDFSVLVRALQTINSGRSLSMPHLLVANNQQGTLDSVLDVPYASTNASNTVTTTSFGGSRPAGTQITIKPQIGSADQLTLDYSVSLSSFTGAASSANLPPPRQENKVQSVATIPDGYTVALGGIELKSDGSADSQVPLLGQIPVLGEAFKNRSRNSSDTRFYIFIRAAVMRSERFEDLRYVSETAAAGAGVDDGMPVVEPRVIR